MSKVIAMADAEFVKRNQTGDLVSTSVKINRKFSGNTHNFLRGSYSACETIARVACDDEGFVYLNSEDKVFCYGKQEEDNESLHVGVGLDACTAKEAILSDAYNYRTLTKTSYRVSDGGKKIIENETKLVLHYCQEIEQDTRVRVLTRDFTWHFPGYPGKEVTEYKTVFIEGSDFYIVVDGNGEFSIFQGVDNDFAVKLSCDSAQIDNNTLFITRARSLKRNNEASQYVVFGLLDTNFGKVWAGYESDKNPYWEANEIIAQMCKKIANTRLYRANQILGRGENVLVEDALKYFESNQFTGTPEDSHRVGNCARGTWAWMKKHLKLDVETPESVSWENFPIPVGTKFVPTQKELSEWSKDCHFNSVLLLKFRESEFYRNTHRNNLTEGEMLGLLFGNTDPLTQEEIQKMKNFFQPKEEVEN